MVLIPKKDYDPDMEQLNEWITSQPLRGYLGMSMLGNDCLRFLQLSHYWTFTPEFNARMLRLFKVGHNAEPMLIRELNKLGITVTDDQKQIVGTAGHIKGHIDGIGHRADMDDFLVEFKTHNEKSFAELKKKGVYNSKPIHYSQMTSYMGGLGLKKALYVAYNKNTSEIYLEWVDFCEDHYRELKGKEFDILSAEELIEKIGSGQPTWFQCKMCDAKKECHGKKDVNKNCRTCQHSDVLDKGEWACSLNDSIIDNEQQIAGCNNYKKDEMFR